MESVTNRVVVYIVFLLTLSTLTSTITFFYTDILTDFRPAITGMATQGLVNVSVIGFASLTVNSNVEFGEGAIGATGNETVLTTETNHTGTFNDCGDGVNWSSVSYDCRGIEIENDGNVRINISMSATSSPNAFWEGDNNTDEFKFATLDGNRSDEENNACVNNSLTNVSIYPRGSTSSFFNWTDIPTSATLICANLSFSVNDTITIEFNLTVPSDEPVGVKSNTFTFTAEQI